MKRFGYKVVGLCYVAVVLTFAAATLFILPGAETACAAGKVKVADSPCDAEYFESMVARATLEADREVTQNQNLIYKPDSVLSYTCFDKHLSVLAEEAENMFSETDRWGEVLGGNHTQHMDLALSSLVSEALVSYLDLNFHGDGEKKYLGGRANLEREDPPVNVSGGTYGCDVMQKVWMEAKCYDFIKIEDTDGFYPFDYYKDEDDLRRLPHACTGGKPAFDTNLTTALESPPWQNDKTVTYLDRFDAAECGNMPALPTGIEVERVAIEPRQYDEKVCIQPGCHYDPKDKECVP